MKRVISLFLAFCLMFMTLISASAIDVSQPFGNGTADSEYFRIPSLITLDSGRILASADVRYGYGIDSPANIDTGVRYSDDNGASWSDVQLINHFTDLEDASTTVLAKASASFIDSACIQDTNGRIYNICDALPAFLGSPYAKKSGNGYIDGKLVACDKTTEDKLESTELDKNHYPYYIGEFDGKFAPVCKFSDGSVYDNYYVDRNYNLYQNGQPVMISQLSCDGAVTEKMTQANIFYALSPIKIYPAFYLWLRTSDDNGETWSDPVILNTQINSKGFTGVCPGRGFIYKNRIMFGIYDNNDGREYTSVIYSDDFGRTWSRSEKAKRVGFAGKSSESQFVLLNDDTIRMYSRNTAGYISYADSTDGGQTWSRFKLDFSLKYCSNCMISFINYSGEIDGKKVIIASYPYANKRKLGTVRIGLVDDKNNVDWKYRYNVTEDTENLTFIYSCLTELSDGRIGLLYENRAAEITYTTFDIDELEIHDKPITFFRILIDKIKQVFGI